MVFLQGFLFAAQNRHRGLGRFTIPLYQVNTYQFFIVESWSLLEKVLMYAGKMIEFVCDFHLKHKSVG
ncbi:hypothetical protein ACH48_15045 [Aeromonas caviae]|nr:hypothetical protein ACH48_15045 [Aeromonas caviae]